MLYICKCSEFNIWDCYSQYPISLETVEQEKSKFAYMLEENYYKSMTQSINGTFIDFLYACFSYLNKASLLDHKLYTLLNDILVNMLPQIEYFSPNLQLSPYDPKPVYNIGFFISNSRLFDIYYMNVIV